MATIERHVTNALVALDAMTPCREAAKVMRDKKIGSVAVREGDTADTLAARVLEAEHRIYPAALKFLAEGRVRVVDGRCRIDGRADADGLLFVPNI